MSKLKYKNPNYSEGGNEPKYLTIPSIVAKDPIQTQYLDMSMFTEGSGTLSSEDYQKVVDAYNNKITIAYVSNMLLPIGISYSNSLYTILANYPIVENNGVSTIHSVNYIINESDKTYVLKMNTSTLEMSGDGTKFLSNNGTYKEVSSSSASDSTIMNLNSILLSSTSSSFDGDINTTISIDDYNRIKQHCENGGYFTFGTHMSASQYSMASYGFYTGFAFIQFGMIWGWSITAGSHSDENIGEYATPIFDCMWFTPSEDGVNCSVKRKKYILDWVDILPVKTTNSTYNTDNYNLSPQPQKIVTESEYTALGATVNSDNVLYFITQD